MTYTVYGPFEVERAALDAGGKVLKAFWTQEGVAEVADSRGVYVFGMRAGPGITPYYVGKATKTFRSECFSDHKKGKYLRATYKRRGTPVMFFVVRPAARGPVNKREIGEIEEHLIVAGWKRNPEISNSQGIGEPSWRIHGVLRSPTGKPGDAATQFRKMMGL